MPTSDGKLPGLNILADGVAIEERLVYDKIHMSVLGLCREHLGAHNPGDFTEQSMKNLKDSLNAGKDDPQSV